MEIKRVMKKQRHGEKETDVHEEREEKREEMRERLIEKER
jgi:hypothetical protein